MHGHDWSVGKFGSSFVHVIGGSSGSLNIHSFFARDF